MTRMPPAGPLLAVLASMTAVQVGAAISVTVFDTLGVVGTVVLRVLVAAVVLLAVARPWRDRAGLGGAVVLGVVSGLMMMAFAQASHRLPLGTVVAVEFCGPLAVAAFAGRKAPATSGRRPGGGLGGVRWLVWPGLAALGVLALTRPWALGGTAAGTVRVGLGFAAVAACGWAAYILLTATVGRRTSGFGGLAVSMATAAVTLAPIGLPQVAPAIGAALGGSAPDLRALALGGLAALLAPLLAFALEMAALRHVQPGVFGVWMALEPAIGTCAGVLLLGQPITVWQLTGVGLVTIAGAGANAAAAPRKQPQFA